MILKILSMFKNKVRPELLESTKDILEKYKYHGDMDMTELLEAQDVIALASIQKDLPIADKKRLNSKGLTIQCNLRNYDHGFEMSDADFGRKIYRDLFEWDGS